MLSVFSGVFEWLIFYVQIQELGKGATQVNMGKGCAAETHSYIKICQNMRPIFIPEPKILRKKVLERYTIFVSDWWNWAYFCANFREFWKYDPCLYPFLH